jgi:1,4-dihydroxy-2-naphthoate octaprenyltransferase
MLALRKLLRIAQPLYLALAALTYVLGAGIARYLGTFARPAVFWTGLGCTLLALLSMSLLAAVFQPVGVLLDEHETSRERIALRDAALYVSIAALAAFGVLGLTLYREHTLTFQPTLSLGLSLLVVLLYAVPPARLKDKGFGELLLAIQIAYLAPSIGFMLQTQSSHRLLDACIVPLTVLLLATLLALDFPSYAEDLKFGRQTALTRLGWQMTLPLHHGLLLSAYGLLASATLLGFSFSLLWPTLLTIPFAVLQYLFLRNIALGGRPIWGLLTANAVIIFGLTTYLLTLSFWMR